MQQIHIDFVLPWVDGADPYWQKQKEKYLPDHTGLKDGIEVNRYQDLGTLRYVLRSIEQHCPWYNCIYLITEGHYPDWLDINHPKIKLVSHRDFFIHAEDLPVFNSSAIEMNLVNLHGLSEYFVYLNDDTFIFNDVPVDRFFQNNLPVDFLCHGWLKRNKLFKLIRGNNSWIEALNNNINLINQDFTPTSLNNRYLFSEGYSVFNKISNFMMKYFYKKYFWFEHWHLPQPYTRKTLKEVYKRFSSAMLQCSRNRFRSPTDLTVYLNRYWHLATGQFIPKKNQDGFVCNISTLKQLRKIIRFLNKSKDINFLCLNDTFQAKSVEEFDNFKKELMIFFEEKFPTPASFEKLDNGDVG